MRARVLVALLGLPNVACVIPLGSDGSVPVANSNDSGVSSGGPGIEAGDGSGPVAGWVNVTGNLANMPSECGNMSFMSAKPDEDMLVAGIALDGLWATRNGGDGWSALGAGSDASAPITNRTSSIVYDPQNTMRWWESGIYNGGGVYETTDDGATFVQLGSVSHIDLVSVDFTDPGRQTLVAGGHEQAQTVYRSTDGGMTWQNVGAGLPASSYCSFPLVISSSTYLVGCNGNGGGVAGVYRTTDGAATWASVSSGGGGGAPLVSSDASIYWASPNGKGMVRSVDQGQTWSSVVSSGVIASFAPLELPDGRIVEIAPLYGPTQSIVASSDHGATWKAVSSALPFSNEVGFAYSTQRKAFYVWQLTCGNGSVPVPTNAIMRFDFDYQKN
jgi:hypothetical protein